MPEQDYRFHGVSRTPGHSAGTRNNNAPTNSPSRNTVGAPGNRTFLRLMP